MLNHLRLLLIMGTVFTLPACDVFDDDEDDDNGYSSSGYSSSRDSSSGYSSSSNSSSSSSNSSSISAATPITVFKSGVFALTDIGETSHQDLKANANLMVSGEDSMVEVYATGLLADSTYPAHVHNGLCEDGGGGHYLQDPNGEDVASNGLWPILETSADGEAYTIAFQDFVVNDDARSVVIHHPDNGERLACADLIRSWGRMGEFSTTEFGSPIYPNLSGSAYAVARGDSWSKAEVSVSGLTADVTYNTHVHVGDCASGGGGHYLQDTTGEDIAENGLWPIVNTNAWGYGEGWASNPFAIRFADAQSVVIHQTGASDRIACADLDTPIAAFRSGSFSATTDGAALYSEINGRAMLTITVERESTARIYVTGLNPETEYPAHVHNQACETGGGGHYLNNASGADVAENGLFPFVTTTSNGTGWGNASNDFVVRADAQSVVIHEPGSGTRIACADLN